MTTALRLPDAFTPGCTSAAAATPTCCCCCSCVVSVVSASVALSSGFSRDMEEQRPKSPGRRLAAKVLLAMVPGLLAIALFLVPAGLAEGGPIAIGLAIATVLAAALSVFGGSETPWRASIRFAGWSLAAAAEFFVILMLLGWSMFAIPVYLILFALVMAAVVKRYR